MFINNLSEIVSHYDGYVVDLWGVLHNGQESFPYAVLALAELKKLNKKIILLSNSPRRVKEVEKRLAGMGILRNLYDEVYTSGEDCYQSLEDPTHYIYSSFGNKYYHIGPEKNRSMAAELSRVEVKALHEADFILVTGTTTWELSIDPYLGILEQACQKNLPMICANPDLTAFYGKEEVICAGMIAQAYENMGGKVYYHGKPYLDVYTKILPKFSLPSRKRILAIGDSLRTDIQGGGKAGTDTLLVLSGVHNHFQNENDSTICEFSRQNYDVEPTYIASKLQF